MGGRDTIYEAHQLDKDTILVDHGRASGGSVHVCNSPNMYGNLVTFWHQTRRQRTGGALRAGGRELMGGCNSVFSQMSLRGG